MPTPPHPPPARVAPNGRRRARAWATAVAGTAALLLAACTRDARVSSDDRAQLADGARLADSLTSAPRWDDGGVVALGYLERLRLGLGSPFRLAEQAAADRRLPGPLGRRTAWAILAATDRGQAFTADPAALGSDADPAGAPTVADGAWHQALVDAAIADAASARTGEEGVRVAYALARAEGLVAPRVVAAAVHAAALARDRRLAAADVRRLLDATRRARQTDSSTDALMLLREWRANRRFLVEAPLLSDALAPDPSGAVGIAERLLARMRAAAAVPIDAPVAASLDAPAITTTRQLGVLPPAAARRLAALPSARAAYPSAPVVVTLGGFRHVAPADTLPGADTTAALRRVRTRLVARARTEELLAAEWAAMRGDLPADGPARRELAALVQAAAVGVRPWAQAPAVGVAVGTPTSRPGALAEVDAVRARDGYRSVEFDPGTPPAWRAAAARQLGDATADLRAVLGDVTLDGLRVRVGDTPRRDLALALHEPATRTVYLPPATGAGTVAHELVHDLDWQAARAPVARAGPAAGAAPRGGYHTDHLARAGTGALAQAVRGLGGSRAASRLAVSAAAPGTPLDVDRPAERLARGADFYVAAALARAGRANGVLSAVQDAVLTGYAGVTAPEPGDGAAESLADVLDALTGPPAAGDGAARRWYLARFGAAGVRSPLAVAGFALSASPVWDRERVLRAAGVPGGLTAVDAPGVATVNGSCGVGGGTAATWQPRLLWLAADARARGLVRARAAHAVAAGSPFWGWTARGTLGGPWSPEPAQASIARVRDAVLRAALADARRAAGACALLPAAFAGRR